MWTPIHGSTSATGPLGGGGGGMWRNGLMVMQKYATGGLADFTGPAWLDGTRSRPEMVLNARDTENFIQLKDILSEILAGATTIHHQEQTSSGDNYFDIQISVDNIEDDYSVDEMAERIKEIIYEDATYRNVTAINNLR
jgi:hypothetical protein